MNSQDQEDRQPADEDTKTVARRPYAKPEVRHERVFETQALSCGKVNPIEGTCGINRKNS